VTTEPTVLTLSRARWAVIVFGPATFGVLLAVVLPVLARWLTGLGVPLPFGFLFRLVAAVDGGREVAVQAAAFAVVGALSSVEILRRMTRVTITDERLEMQTAGERRSFARADISWLYSRRDRLILLDHDSREMFHGEPGATRAELRAAFREHGYPWRDEDPYDDLYHRWEPESGRLPVDAEAVLSARAVTLRKNAGKEAAALRSTLEKLGFAVRDEGDKQFWRPLVRR
jgi:hypothetical protein